MRLLAFYVAWNLRVFGHDGNVLLPFFFFFAMPVSAGLTGLELCSNRKPLAVPGLVFNFVPPRAFVHASTDGNRSTRSTRSTQSHQLIMAWQSLAAGSYIRLVACLLGIR